VTGPERRRHPRYELHVSVEVTHDGGHHRCESEDLGAGGCRITLPAALPRGAQVHVRLTSPATRLAPEGAGVIAWGSGGAALRVGIAFSDPLAEQVVPFIQDVLAVG